MASGVQRPRLESLGIAKRLPINTVISSFDDRREGAMPSLVYDLFSQAIAGRKQVLCQYDSLRRELCPVILGHTKGQEKALTYQFGGQSRSGLPRHGAWRCLWLDRVRNVELRDGPWRVGDNHTRPQGCVEAVDLDVNPSSPYNPTRRL
jgi:hypothetical protein